MVNLSKTKNHRGGPCDLNILYIYHATLYGGNGFFCRAMRFCMIYCIKRVPVLSNRLQAISE